MAALARTAMFRHASLPSKRLFFSTTTAFRAASTIRSSLPKPTYTTPISRITSATFHSSTQRNIMPPGPQIIEGGINDPQPLPKMSPTHGSYHWTFERLLSVALVPLTITPFAVGSVNAALDAALVFTILVHSHIGFQACITDYFSTTKHPKLRRFFDWVLNIMTIVVGVAFYEFETNDVGLTEAIKRIWHAGEVNDATVEVSSGMGHDGKMKNLKP